MNKIYEMMPDLQGDEMILLENLTKNYSDDQIRDFANLYRARRKDPQMILLFAFAGLVGFAEIHRFLLNQIGMGILYFFTAGLCLIGTIVDMVNYKTLAFTYNRQVAVEVHHLMGIRK